MVNGPGSVSFCNGNNTANGYVAKWTGIKATDGSFSVTSQQDTNAAYGWNTGTKGYAMTSILLEKMTSEPQEPNGFIAYNDCVYDPTQSLATTNPNGQLIHYISPNVTTYGIGNNFTGSSSGQLVDKATGGPTGVMVTITQSGSVTWQPDISSSWNGGYDCATGTDARNTFGGIADMTGVIYYGSAPGWYVDLTFTGLDPKNTYTFATSAARCNATYTNRGTIYSISGADTFTNASTLGVNVIDEGSVWFNTGDNHSDGYVARWTNIKAADGTFTVRATHHSTAESGYKAYAFDVFMLKEKLEEKCEGVIPADISGPDGQPDCYVNIYDFAQLAKDWLFEGPQLPENLVLHYKLDDAISDGVLDSSAYGNEGTCTAGFTPAVVGGVLGNACEFDGSGKYITAADSSSLDVENITISAWIFVTAYSTDQRIISKEFGTSALIQFIPCA